MEIGRNASILWNRVHHWITRRGELSRKHKKKKKQEITGAIFRQCYVEIVTESSNRVYSEWGFGKIWPLRFD